MKELFSFSGKAGRQEWWTVSILAELALQVCVISSFVILQSDNLFRYPLAGILYLGGIVSFWLVIAVSVKRLRDRGRPPWWLAASLIPVAGWVWYLIECGFLAAPGARGPRRVVRRMINVEGGEGVHRDA